MNYFNDTKKIGQLLPQCKYDLMVKYGLIIAGCFHTFVTWVIINTLATH